MGIPESARDDQSHRYCRPCESCCSNYERGKHKFAITELLSSPFRSQRPLRYDEGDTYNLSMNNKTKDDKREKKIM